MFRRTVLISFRFAGRRYRSSAVAPSARDAYVAEEVQKFCTETPVERATTPPSSWFTDPAIYGLEKRTVFKWNWVAVGRTDQVASPGQYFTGVVGDEPFLVVRDKSNTLRGFFNVCRHHAAILAGEDEGTADAFTCCYHGWTYGLDGRLTKAMRLRGIQNFSARNFGLKPMAVKAWGPLVLVRPDGQEDGTDFETQVTSLKDQLDDLGFTSGLRFVERRRYRVNCNWKVVLDNYLDGGYHVEYLHRNLASNLSIDTYRTDVQELYSVQTCSGSAEEDQSMTRQRIGKTSIYGCVYPNLMINRYGPWLDTNIALPLTHDTTEVIYDYWLAEEFAKTMRGEAELQEFVQTSLTASDQVQQEDTFICERVQKGLRSSAYDVGRYAPRVEMADHAFHLKLASDLKQGIRTDKLTNGIAVPCVF
ncbi:hypothetical protein Bbelb_387310 [Branchiostoma belcheri]|nr:hypothetical protein Bbelb_387310 [Branchiostoma belcheri]